MLLIPASGSSRHGRRIFTNEGLAAPPAKSLEMAAKALRLTALLQSFRCTATASPAALLPCFTARSSPSTASSRTSSSVSPMSLANSSAILELHSVATAGSRFSSCARWDTRVKAAMAPHLTSELMSSNFSPNRSIAKERSPRASTSNWRMP